LVSRENENVLYVVLMGIFFPLKFAFAQNCLGFPEPEIFKVLIWQEKIGKLTFNIFTKISKSMFECRYN
jgi:hypothetical protein